MSQEGGPEVKGAKNQSNECRRVNPVPLVRRMATMPPDLMLEFHSVAAFKELR